MVYWDDIKYKTESHIQKYVDDLLTYNRIWCIRLPDHLFRAIYKTGKSVSLRVKGLISKYIKGLPDNLAVLPLPGGFFLGCALEQKSKSGTLSPYQKKWQKILNTHVIRTEEQAKNQVDQFIKTHKQLEGFLNVKK